MVQHARAVLELINARTTHNTLLPIGNQPLLAQCRRNCILMRLCRAHSDNTNENVVLCLEF